MDEKSQAQARKISAHLLLSRATLIDAPDYVTNALKAWIRSLEPGTPGHEETVGVGDSASVGLIDVKGRKSDA